jgi:hypothetical protein
VQNGAIGRALMHAVLERAHQRGTQRVRLVQAAYHARSMSLYTKLGFALREPLVVLQGNALQLRIDGHAVRPLQPQELDAANRLCRELHGHDRGGELAHAQRQGSATLVERGGRITGYSTGLGFFGHSVGETNDDLKALIGAAPRFDGPGLLLPTRNTELFRWSLEQGLRVVMPMSLMSLGPYAAPRGAFLPSILY